jgi:hypothetical protein
MQDGWEGAARASTFSSVPRPPVLPCTREGSVVNREVCIREDVVLVKQKLKHALQYIINFHTP